MTSVIGDFVERVDFDSYEDFFENFKLTYNCRQVCRNRSG